LSHILDDVEDYVDYDMDFETGPKDGRQDVDPYAGTFIIRNMYGFSYHVLQEYFSPKIAAKKSLK